MTPYVAIERGDDVFLLPTSTDPKLFVHAERSDFVVLERAAALLTQAGHVLARETFVDVGAHIGTTTISALSRHGFRRAVSIEPDPAHLPLLRANVALNALDERVTVVPGGAADTDRRQSFLPGSRKESSHRWMKGRLVDEPSPRAVTVDTITLDGLAEAGVVDPAAAGLLWFDCSRCEEAALASAAAFLKRRVPIVFTVRQGQFADSSPFLARLEERYGRIVDLRSPNLAEATSSWQPRYRPVRELTALPEGKKLTDVLLL